MAALPFTTKEDVKAALGWTGAGEDDLIDQLILEVSREAEDYMGRHGLIEERTEVYKLKPNRRYVSLRGFPNVEVTSVKYARNEDFDDVDELEADTYHVKSATGQIRFRTNAIAAQYNPGFVQVVYTGGLAEDEEGLKEDEPRLEGAVRTEVINRFNRRKHPEGNLATFGTSVGYQGQMKPLDDFKTALDHRRRLRL